MARQGQLEPQALRRARVAAGLTQHELARLVGVAGGERVSRWERGLSTPQPDILARTAAVLGVDVDSLLVRHGHPIDLRSLRFARGLTIEGLARDVHVSKSTVSRWETGQASRELTPSAIRLLAKTLGVSVAAVRTAVSHRPSRDL